MNKMKKCRAAGIVEMRVEMLLVAERIGIWWTKDCCMEEGSSQRNGERG